MDRGSTTMDLKTSYDIFTVPNSILSVTQKKVSWNIRLSI